MSLKNSKRVKDRVLLLLAIKAPGKTVDLNHIYEKINRDCGATKQEIITALRELVSEGLARNVGGNWIVTEDGRKIAWEKLRYDPEMNMSYRLVLLARWYYPKIADAILPFLRGRPVSVVKVFSDEKDPIHKVKPIFSRYAKYRPKTYHRIEDKQTLMRYVDAHAIDYIPYVHTFHDKTHPTWLVIDVDAGEDLKKDPRGFELVKEITKITAEVLEDKYEIIPAVKFSGSRGFQIWCTFEKPLGPFDIYRDAVRQIQKDVEAELQKMYDELREKYGNIFDVPITTSDVAHADLRRRKILLDWSCLKPEGDVRAPFSMHWKTGLVSVPVKLNEILKFEAENAKVEEVVKRKEDLITTFKLTPNPPEKLLKSVKSGLFKFLS